MVRTMRSFGKLRMTMCPYGEREIYTLKNNCNILSVENVNNCVIILYCRII